MSGASSVENPRISLCNIVEIMLGVSIILFAVGLITDPLGTQQCLFFRKFDDLLADFFNPAAHTLNRNPYLQSAHRICTPLYYLIMYPLSFLADYTKSLNELYSDPGAVVSAVLFCAFSEFFLFYMLYRFMPGKKRYCLLLLLFFSGVNLFSIERGTLVIFTAGCIAGFLYFYQSPSRGRQIFSLVLLCLAAALKIYPALFGLFLLKRRDFKGILFCIILTSALGFLPLLFFESGFGNIPQLFCNLGKYRIVYKISPELRTLSLLLVKYGGNSLGNVASVWIKALDVIAISTLVCSFFNNDREKMIFSIAAVISLCPIGAAPYTQLYLFPAFLMFMNRIREKHVRSDLFYAVGYILLFMPWQLPGNINKIFILTVLPAMLVIQLTEVITAFRQSGKSVREIIKLSWNNQQYAG